MGSCVKNVCTKNIKIYQYFFKLQSIIFGMFFYVFVHFNAYEVVKWPVI